MKTPKEIGESIRELRGKESLRDFAAKCDISHTALDAIEKGYNSRTGKPTFPSAITLEKIANAANVPLSYLIGTDNQNKNAVFAERLKMALNNQAMKKAELANIIGVDRSYITNYISEKYMPNSATLSKIALALGVTEAWLVGYDVPVKQCPSAEISSIKPMKDILKQLRISRGYSQKELGAILGETASAIDMYEIGERCPNNEMLQKYIKLFGVDYNYLYGMSDNIESNTSQPEDSLGDIEKELLRICGQLDMRKKNALLTKAYELMET